MGRSPALVRYLWGLWTAQEVGIADISGVGMMTIKQDILRLTWITKLVHVFCFWSPSSVYCLYHPWY